MIYAGADIAKMDHMVTAIDKKEKTISRPMLFKNSRR
jgi:hypothetical protein